MRYFNIAIGFFLLASGFTAMAGEMECGTHIISDGEISGQTKHEIRQKCGKPHEESGNDWYYKKEEGLTHKLHFNDSGQLESISTQ